MTSVELFVSPKKGKTLDTEIVTEATTCVDFCVYSCFNLSMAHFGSLLTVIYFQKFVLYGTILLINHPIQSLSLSLSLSLSQAMGNWTARNGNVVLNKARGLSSKLELVEAHDISHGG